ncbi:MAG: cytochrome c [Verrucomicrobiales bacterium]|nr:cytochrome c [Verrucomicrobiales bacterium]
MSLRVFLPAIFCFIPVLFSSCEKPQLRQSAGSFDPTSITDETPLLTILKGLGEEVENLPPDSRTEEKVESGYELASEGHLESTAETQLSSYFYCFDCHGLSPDSPLPAATFSGLVNRTTFFNGASAVRYGDSSNAHTDLNEAIQFCSSKIARGRALKQPEMDALLAYLWSLELKLGDLSYTGADLAELKRRSLNPAEHAEIVQELQERYLTVATVTKGSIPEDSATGYVLESSPDKTNGEKIWKETCLHCHDAEGASEHFFGDKISTWKNLAKRFSGEGEESLYHLLRSGTFDPDQPGSHMPMFSKERLSDTDIEDLRYFISSLLEIESAPRED